MNFKKNRKILFIVIFFIAFFHLTIQAVEDISIDKKFFHKSIIVDCLKINNPFFLYAGSDLKKQTICEKMYYTIKNHIPIVCYIQNENNKIEITKEYLQEEAEHIRMDIEGSHEKEIIEIPIALQEKVLLENNKTNSTKFTPVMAPVAIYSKEQLKEQGFIKENFYIEDSTTLLKEEQLNYNVLNSFDATLKQDNSKPQILIYHTHSQEAYIDSDITDENTTIIGVGERLCKILREEYGYNVLHHTGKYDVESRDYAYSNAMKGLEKVLEENPSIEVIIDLHRDEVKEDTKLVTTIQEIPMAKFMFFNGLSYTKELGELESLPNPYVQDNLSFSFQMQIAAEEYYPGLTRKIYLKGYRYNLHYRAKSLLVELGAQTNTVEEAMNSCEPLAHIISMVLK